MSIKNDVPTGFNMYDSTDEEKEIHLRDLLREVLVLSNQTRFSSQRGVHGDAWNALRRMGDDPSDYGYSGEFFERPITCTGRMRPTKR